MIPADVARQLGDAHEKDIVLLVMWDQKSNQTAIVTWGRLPVQKEAAAKSGDWLARELGLAEQIADVHEDYRREGEAAKTVDGLRRKLNEISLALENIVVSEGEDAGVLLMSHESPTHYDETLKCQVYDHPHFSELGDALVSLATLAKEEA
jgi:hypothetical protein